MKIWNWRTGVCVSRRLRATASDSSPPAENSLFLLLLQIRTLAGHTDGIVCLNYDKNVLASGSADSTIKVWNFRNGDCFTLRGHRDWVNSVVLWDGTTTPAEPDWSSTSSLLSSHTAASSSTSPQHPSSAPPIDPGKMLFSGSDDGTIRLWDLSTRECVKVMEGHVGQVQSMRLMIVDREKEDDEQEEEELVLRVRRSGSADADVQMDGATPQEYEPNPLGVVNTFSHPVPIVPSHRRHEHEHPQQQPARQAKSPRPQRDGKQAILVSASLDNTVKVWDVETGKSRKTLFGHSTFSRCFTRHASTASTDLIASGFCSQSRVSGESTSILCESSRPLMTEPSKVSTLPPSSPPLRPRPETDLVIALHSALASLVARRRQVHADAGRPPRGGHLSPADRHSDPQRVRRRRGSGLELWGSAQVRGPTLEE